MKKFLSSILVLTLIFVFCACSNKKDITSVSNTSTTQSEVETANNGTTSSENNTNNNSSDTAPTSSSQPISSSQSNTSSKPTVPSHPTVSSKPNTTTSAPYDEIGLVDLILVVSPGQNIQVHEKENEEDGITLAFATNKKSKFDVKKIEIVSAKINGKETKFYQTDNTEKFNHIYAKYDYENTNEFFKYLYNDEGLTDFKELKTIAFVHVSYIMMLQHSLESVNSSVDVILTIRCTFDNNQFVEKTMTTEVWAGAGGFFVLPEDFN